MSENKETVAQVEEENVKKHAIFEAISSGNVAQVRNFLVESPLVIKETDPEGMTCLQYAAYRGNLELCELLLSYGADVNSRSDRHGYSPLMFAALSGKSEIVKLFLNKGASTTFINGVGRTATQMAAFCGQHHVVPLINNFCPISRLLYHTIPHGIETSPKLNPDLARSLHEYILEININPISLVYCLERNNLIGDFLGIKKCSKILEIIRDDEFKGKEGPDDLKTIKYHYLFHVMSEVGKYIEKGEKLEVILRRFLVKNKNGAPIGQESFLRGFFKTFPFTDCRLFIHFVRIISQNPIGDGETTLSLLNSSLNGRLYSGEVFCACCSSLGAQKKCGGCRGEIYCSRRCQQLCWFDHKKWCKKAKIDNNENLTENVKKLGLNEVNEVEGSMPECETGKVFEEVEGEKFNEGLKTEKRAGDYAE